MATAKVTICGLCGRPLDMYSNGRTEKAIDKNGFCVEIGYSLGGWGQRKNHVNFSDEVCVDCYGELMPAVEHMKNALQGCRTHTTPREARKFLLGKGR